MGSRTFLRHVRCSLRSVSPALLPPGSIECGARARVCVADIGEVGSAAQGQAELGGRTESNLIDVMLALQAGGDGGQASCAELLQLVQTPVPRLPANLLPGGPLSSANIRPSTRPPEGGSLPRRSDLPAPLRSGGREYREVVGFLPALPERHTFVKAELPSMTPDPGSFVNEHSAQRQRTATRRQIEMSLCKLRAAAVVERQQMGGATAGAGGNGNVRGGGPTRTVVGLGAALQLSAMNERAGRYKDEGSGSGLWGQEVLSPQTFVSNDALLAAGGGVARESGGGRAPKRKREAPAPAAEQPRLQDRAQTQQPVKTEPASVAAADTSAAAATGAAAAAAVAVVAAPAQQPVQQKPSPFKRALVLGGQGAAGAAGTAGTGTGTGTGTAAGAAGVAETAAVAAEEESDDDDKPLVPAKRPALTIGNKPKPKPKARPSLTIKSSASRAASAASSAPAAPAPQTGSGMAAAAPSSSGTAAAAAPTLPLPNASPLSSPEQSPVSGAGPGSSGADIPMTHPKLMKECRKMIEEIKAYQASWPFLQPGAHAHEMQ